MAASAWQSFLQSDSLLRARLPPTHIPLRLSNHSRKQVIRRGSSVNLTLSLPARASKSLVAVTRVIPVEKQKNFYSGISRIGSTDD
jgi:hypothetical protein